MKGKALMVAAVLGLALSGAGVASAQDGSGVAPVSGTTHSPRQQYQDERAEFKKHVSGLREEARSELQDGHTGLRQDKEAAVTEMKKRRAGVKGESEGLTPEEREAKKSELMAERTVKMNTRWTEFQDRRVELIGKFALRMETVRAAMGGRLDTLADRIESRINKIEDEKGWDLSEARVELAEARVLIDAAREASDVSSQLAVLVSEIEGISFEDRAKVKEVFGSVKDLLHSPRQALRDAHGSLVESVRAIKAVVEAETADAGTETTDIGAN